MHELSLARELVRMAEQAARDAGAVSVGTVRVRVGVLRQIDELLLHEAFAAARTDTCCAGASLDLLVSEITARCPACGATFAVHDWCWRCPHCRAEGEPLPGGDELELVSIDAEVPE